VDRPKSYQVDVLCIDYPSELTVTSGYGVLFSHLPLLSILVRELYHLVSLPRCRDRSSGQTQILSSGCIVRRLPKWCNSYMWLQSTFLSYPTTFLTFQRTVSSYLVAKVEVVDRPKSYQVDVFSVDYPSHLGVTCGYKVLFSLITYFPYFSETCIIFSPCHSKSSGHTQILSSWCIERRLPESSNNYMWLWSMFLSYPTTFHSCKRTISSCLLAIVEVVDRQKSYQVDVLCVDYPSELIVTSGCEVLFSLLPLLSLLVRELYRLVSLP
jgi:hypothetical protein